MYKKIELVGSSEIDFNSAINNILTDLQAKNYKINQFTVIEQRGFYINNNLVYQVILNLEIEFDERQLFEARQSKAKVESNEIFCQWCGCSTNIPFDTNSEKINSTFVCNSCGRIISITDKFKNKLK